MKKLVLAITFLTMSLSIFASDKPEVCSQGNSIVLHGGEVISLSGASVSDDYTVVADENLTLGGDKKATTKVKLIRVTKKYSQELVFEGYVLCRKVNSQEKTPEFMQ